MNQFKHAKWWRSYLDKLWQSFWKLKFMKNQDLELHSPLPKSFKVCKERSKERGKTEWRKQRKASCSLLVHFWSTYRSLFSTLYIPFQSLGIQDSNALNGVWIGAEMRKIWPSQDNYIQLISIRVGIPSGCRHSHPDVSHPESGYCHLHPAPHPPPGWHPEFRIQMGKEAFQLPRSAMSQSSMALTPITPSWRQNVAQLQCSPEASWYLRPTFWDLLGYFGLDIWCLNSQSLLVTHLS